MWKNYSASYLKHNRATGMSIMAAALISALFLSLLCSFFYNFWTYEVEQIVLEEGDWQARLTGDFDENDLASIRNFTNVEKAVRNKTAVDLCFNNPRTIFQDVPLIMEYLGLEEDAAEYHLLLLSRYLIHDPQDQEPPLLLTFYLVVLLLVSLSLILIIHNSFAVSMNTRIHQFGIFSSIGATPGQIRTCLMQEAAVLCAVPILLGSLLGIAIGYGIMQAANVIAADAQGRHEAVWQYHPLVLVITVLSAVLTVLFSAWIPARKLSRLTPLEAIRNTGQLRLKKKRKAGVLSLLFGIEGELAGNALKAQKKALRTSTISLTLSFLGFTMMLCFFTLSGISTRQTYFEKYQNVWDIMVTVMDTKLEDFKLAEEVGSLPGVRDSVVYQKAAWTITLPEEWQSEELIALGGLEEVAGSPVKAPMAIMDDASFTEYCTKIGIAPRLDGAIVLNQIWDSKNSDFRHKKYIPFVKEDWEEIPVLAYTQHIPELREEYANYALVHFLPVSMWKEISGQVGEAEADIYIRILAGEGTTLEELNELEAAVTQLVGAGYKIESENRIQEKVTNDDMINGFMLILSAFCLLLAVIGIANVFSNTLGFLYQRKREFAQYMSVGMTPGGMRKMFCLEVLVIAGRPLLITLPLTAAFVAFAVTASHLEPIEFLAEVPAVPIAIFSLFIFAFVALAYYIGGRRVFQFSLTDALRNDTVI